MPLAHQLAQLQAVRAGWLHPSCGEQRTTSAKLLPRMGVSLWWQDMSQPASPEHPEYSCLNRGHCSHIPARHWSALHRWRASPASLAAGARHRWLPSRNIGPVACRPAEAGLGISTDGSARVDPQEQAAGQRARIMRGPCRTQKPHPLCRASITCICYMTMLWRMRSLVSAHFLCV